MQDDNNDMVANTASEEVREILSRVPNWIVRFGTVAIVVVIFLFLVIGYFLKFPVVIRGNLKLTTIKQPVKIVNKVSGNIEKLYYGDNTDVVEGSNLALIENPLNDESARFLLTFVTGVKEAINDNSLVISPDTANRFSFGHLEEPYNNILRFIREYHLLMNDPFYSTKIESLNSQVKHYENLISITKLQIKHAEKALENSKEKYEIDKKLFAKNILSHVDFLKVENDYLNQSKDFENTRRSVEEANITRLQYLKELNDIEFEKKQKELQYKESIIQSIKVIESSVNNWRQNYLLKAPVSGRLIFIQNIIEKQFVGANQELFEIVPRDENYFGILDVNSDGFGKLREGQKVRIKLDAYPYQEFGQLIGSVKSISRVPFSDASATDKFRYRLRIELSNSNNTTYHKTVQLAPEMKGTGEVITNDLTILQRLFYQVRGDLSY